jgi:outer membrane protein assembly factor BamB
MIGFSTEKPGNMRVGKDIAEEDNSSGESPTGGLGSNDRWPARILPTMPERIHSDVRRSTVIAKSGPIALLIILILLAVSLPTCPAADWPQFLGPTRNGISSETGLTDGWSADGPKEMWRVKGGAGMSGMAVSGGALVTLVQRDGKQFAVALSAASGRTIWQTAVAPEYRNSMGNGPRATPTVAGSSVFVFTGQGILVSLERESGKINWSRPLLRELNGRPAEYGMACSPLVVGEQVIVTVGAPRVAVVACDAKSGKQLWTAGREATGYSSPAVLKVAGQPQIVVHTGSAVLGLEPGSGKALWRHPYQTAYDCNIATPIAVAGKVFVSSGENHGSALLQLNSKGDRFDVEEIWSSHGPASVLRNEWQTSVLHDGHLYGMDNVGGAGPITHLTCIEAATGKRIWQAAKFGKGNLIGADGKLFISTMRGDLVIVKATPNGFTELARAKVFKGSRTGPSLADGRLCLRDDSEIVCFDIRK